MNAVTQSQTESATPRTRTARPATPRAAEKSAAKPTRPNNGNGTRNPPPGINGFQAPAGSFKQPMQLKLCSTEAIRLAERGFASAQESLYNIAVVLPRHQGEDIDTIASTEAQLEAVFEGLAKEIQVDLNKYRLKAKEAGIKVTADNSVPLETTVDLYTKQSIQLLNILKDYDEMTSLTFALSFASQITNAERVQNYSVWRNRLGRFIRSLKYQYLLLRNRGALGHVEEPAGDMTEDALSAELESLDVAARDAGGN